MTTIGETLKSQPAGCGLVEADVRLLFNQLAEALSPDEALMGANPNWEYIGDDEVCCRE